MIQPFVDRFMESKDALLARYKADRPDSYEAIVKDVVAIVYDADDYGTPDPNRIHVINDGDYQGTLLFVIAAEGYQPSTYWAIFVHYGSCSGCDTYESLRGWDDAISDSEAEGYVTLALHMVQSMREIGA